MEISFKIQRIINKKNMDGYDIKIDLTWHVINETIHQK